MDLTKNQKILSTLLEKAWDDPDFTSELIENPEEVIKKTTGESYEIPDGKELVVVDQTDPTKVYLNLPAKPNMDEIELTDEQLELIAGGATDAQIIAGGGGP